MTTPKVDDRFEVRRILTCYVRGDQWNLNPTPDDQIVERVIAAAHGASVQKIREFLLSVYKGGQKVGTRTGPKSWGWFPTVINKRFRESKESLRCPTCGALRETTI